ncbi:YjgP/YjgQ family permease [Segetibacter sp. 3557_3]|uniref:LptF/LptG family permease n=1 Tax=Segetibacter sp. 3557_3 TaxID=2547429 RepID=UPI0010586725|nr:LptF/LptG family permease [Segetibacter sp. 3557_3]TDH25543.1 YjgP/YjgQ family permease [Segetibacter sp. 3557_3]
MIKKLDSLIIRSFIGPFLATFLISLFVLVMQFFWLYIDDLVGKGLDFLTIAKLTGFVAATAVPLALPLSLLLSSIMTFGNLGESFELVAIKSAGIPLLRFMRPLLIVAILIAGVAFLFANNIIPVANLKLNTLKYDIIVSKPAFDIKEGVFYDRIEGYVIKIGKKDKDGSTIRNVVIYEKNYGLQDYSLLAESGTMSVTADKRFLEFNLKNGWRYQEKGNRQTTNTEFIRLGFKEYKKVLDLSSFKMNKTSDSVFKDNFKMLSLRQLNKAIDSLDNFSRVYKTRAKQEVSPYFGFAKYQDTGWTKINTRSLKQVKSFDQVLPDSVESYIYDRALSQINSARSNVDMLAEDYKVKQKDFRYYLIERHRKLTLSVACIVLFLIGAPLGSIIRKGGLGTPLVFAVIFFVIFHLFNTFGEKFVKENVMTPFAGMWLSTAVLIPIGIFLTYKAMRDSQLFNQEFYHRTFKQFKTYLSNFRQRKTANT